MNGIRACCGFYLEYFLKFSVMKACSPIRQYLEVKKVVGHFLFWGRRRCDREGRERKRAGRMYISLQ